MTIAAGGRCLSDPKTLRDQPELFGTVASDATAWWAVHQVDEVLLEELVGVRQAATRQLLQATDLDDHDGVVLDVDATLINLNSEDKQGAAATFKGTFGFAPMRCVSSSRSGCPPGACGRATPPRTTPATSSPRSIRPSRGPARALAGRPLAR